MFDFQIGDRVEAVERYTRISVGMTGIVFSTGEGHPPLGIKWDNFEGKGHDGTKGRDPTRSSYYVEYSTARVLPQTLENE